MLPKIDVLGIGITNASEQDILEYIRKALEKTSKKLFIVTPNPEIIVFATKNPEFKTILNNAQIALPDGIGVVLAAQLLRKKLLGRVTGVDFLEKLCERSIAWRESSFRKPITVGFLGGQESVALRTAECLLSRYPELAVVFVGQEWGEEGFVRARKILGYKDTRILGNEKLTEKYSRNIQISQYPSIDILFVAYGFPKQERWIFENLPEMPVRVAMGVGGAFDYISGSVARAPYFLRALGLEWLFRLIVQPWRLRRQMALIQFVWFILKEKFGK